MRWMPCAGGCGCCCMCVDDVIGLVVWIDMGLIDNTLCMRCDRTHRGRTPAPGASWRGSRRRCGLWRVCRSICQHVRRQNQKHAPDRINYPPTNQRLGFVSQNENVPPGQPAASAPCSSRSDAASTPMPAATASRTTKPMGAALTAGGFVRGWIGFVVNMGCAWCDTTHSTRASHAPA